VSKPILILGIVGSLRKGSYNKALMHAAMEMAPSGTKLEVFDLEGFPPFTQDQENDPPRRVKDFKARIREADALLISTPEYNYSVPGVLKNAIDWASRPYVDNSFDGKPVGIMGASIGMMGTARAQYHLRQTCIFLNMYPLNKPEVFVTFAGDKIKNGELKDEKTREKIKELMIALVDWIVRFSRK
jgi:chromate reductase